MYNPTSSHISAPSLAPIDTSNGFLEFLFVQTFTLWSYRIVLPTCIVASNSFTAMLWYLCAHLSVLINGLSVIDG